MKAFELSEERLAAQLGVGRGVLRDLRDGGALIQGEDWKVFRPGGICYTLEAVQKVMAALDGERKSEKGHNLITSEEELQRLTDELQRREMVTVVSMPRPRMGWRHFRNPRLLLAKKNDGVEIHVRVRDSKRWRAGDSLKVFYDGMIWVEDTSRMAYEKDAN